MSPDIRFHLPWPVFDTHFHAAHMRRKDLDPSALLTDAFASNLAGAVDVSTRLEDFQERAAFAAAFPALRISAGIHPSSVTDSLTDSLAVLERQALHPKVVAIGETGLDSYRDHSPAHLQETSFRAHLDLASRLGKPVIIHNRDADERVLAIVRESECRQGIFHCFSSDIATAEAALELGFHISLAGNVTFKSNHSLRDVAAMVPGDRILVETDAPFLSPVPRRGRPNHPGHIGYIIDVLAEVRRENPEDLAAQTTRNAERIFGLR